MNARALAIAKVFRTALVAADQLDPIERDAIYTALVADLRSRRPEEMSPLGVLPPPTSPIVDPRGAR